MEFDALYGAPAAPVQQQQDSFLGGLNSFAAPAAQQPDLIGDPFAAPAQSTGLSGMLLRIGSIIVYADLHLQLEAIYINRNIEPYI